VWSEWNGKFRDTVRDFWRGESATLPELASRLTGSSDLYQADTRRPVASINFVTAHDGFTLADLVSYNEKHNEANGEHNNDGESHNRSWNCGAEGPTDDEDVLACRRLQQRNFLVTLLLSQGVPMLLGGDELGRTQRGNNNAYCQANEISWYDWTPNDDSERFQAFTAHVIGLSLAHATLRRTTFFDGVGDTPDIAWLDAQGVAMTGGAWSDPSNHFIAYLLAGDAADEPDDDVLVVLNASLEPASFHVPGAEGQVFRLQLDTGLDEGRPPDGTTFEAASTLDVAAQTVLVASAPRP
jgi:isoamylase